MTTVGHVAWLLRNWPAVRRERTDRIARQRQRRERQAIQELTAARRRVQDNPQEDS